MLGTGWGRDGKFLQMGHTQAGRLRGQVQVVKASHTLITARLLVTIVREMRYNQSINLPPDRLPAHC